jgi:hypothetical protein
MAPRLDPGGAEDSGTRLRDLAVLELEKSLKDLPEGTEFFVVSFGTRARLLRATPGYVRPVESVLRAIQTELQQMTGDRSNPSDELTNLHGALMLALQGGVHRATPQDDYYGYASTSHPQTVFLLSDAWPSCDDWGTRLKDPSIATTEPTFIRMDVLREDCVVRNFFRHCEVNCLVLAGSNAQLLTSIAGSASGRALQIGVQQRPIAPTGAPAAEAVELLRKVMRDSGESETKRAGAVRALAGLGRESLDDLLWGVSSTSEMVREESDAALVAIFSRGFRYFPSMMDWEAHSLVQNWGLWVAGSR